MWTGGEYQRALSDYSKAVEIMPNDVDTRIARAKTYVRLHRGDLALADLTFALHLDPKSTRALTARAVTLAELADFSHAKVAIESAIRSIPGKNFKTKKYDLGSLAWIWATSPADALRDGQKAISYAKKACKLDQWQNWNFVNILAAAYAEAGDFDDAVKYQKQAMRLMPPDRPHVEEQQARLMLYEKHQPYRDIIKS